MLKMTALTERMICMLDVLLDAVLDSLKTLPFLFGAFLLMEAAEKHYGKHMDTILKQSEWGGPLAGSISRPYPTVRFFRHRLQPLRRRSDHARNPSFRLSLHLGRGHHSSAGRFQPGKRYPEAHGHEGHHRYHRRLSRGSDLF